VSFSTAPLLDMLWYAERITSFTFHTLAYSVGPPWHMYVKSKCFIRQAYFKIHVALLWLNRVWDYLWCLSNSKCLWWIECGDFVVRTCALCSGLPGLDVRYRDRLNISHWRSSISPGEYCDWNLQQRFCNVSNWSPS